MNRLVFIMKLRGRYLISAYQAKVIFFEGKVDIMHHILIARDEPIAIATLRETLSDYQVALVKTVTDAQHYLSMNPVGLVVLDIQLGTENGMTVARHIRENYPYTSIVIMTKHRDIQSAIEAVNLSINAYLLEPVSVHHLHNTITDQLEQMQERKQRDILAQHMRNAIANVYTDESDTTAILQVDDQFSLNQNLLEARLGQQSIQFSPIQFRILWKIVNADGEIVSPPELTKDVLGYEVGYNQASDLIKGHISKVRNKLTLLFGKQEKIRNVRGEGYLWIY